MSPIAEEQPDWGKIDTDDKYRLVSLIRAMDLSMVSAFEDNLTKTAWRIPPGVSLLRFRVWKKHSRNASTMCDNA